VWKNVDNLDILLRFARVISHISDMPELPEVEHAMQQLRNAGVGRKIARVRIMHPALERSLPTDAQKALVGRTITSVERRAKIQLITLDDKSILEVHFRMTGDWSFGNAEDEPQLRERGRIDLTDGTRVSLIDGRAFAIMRLHAPGELKLPSLGLEPLSPEFNATVLREALSTRTIPIKQSLLDQKVVSGLGNIYASEALWEAKIAPTRPSNELTAKAAATLVTAIRTVLERAPAGRYYYEGTGEAAEEMGTAWRVYDREGQPCARCKTKIKRIVQGGRSTYFCSKCQKS
jgi:formamidopyrimidine-DNA glycosylase